MSLSQPAPRPRERFARLVLALAIVAAPIGLGVRVATGERTDGPRFQRPAATDLVVITAGVWDDPLEFPTGPAFEDLVQRGQRVGPVWAGTDHRPGAAATLWTGRSAPSHGVLAVGQRLPHGTWTLASAARKGGAHTAAFLAEPLVRESGLSGFATVVEDEGLGAAQLGRLARGYLAEHAGERVALWLHLAAAGRRGADVEALLGEVHAALLATGRDDRVVLVVTAFSNRLDLPDEGRLAVPWVSRMPAAIQAGSISRSALAHVDGAHLLRRLLRLEPPSELDGQAELHGDALAFWSAMRGTPETSWVWLEGAFGSVLRQPGVRAHRTPDGTLRFEALPDTRRLGALEPLRGAALESARWVWDDRREAAHRR